MTAIEPDWWREVRSLDDMVAHREAFLAAPGCDVDVDDMVGVLELDDAEGQAVMAAWFDVLVATFRAADAYVVYRHMRVADFDALVDGLEAGAATGAHWSLSEEIESPDADGLPVDVLLKGEIDARDVDWYGTFRNAFAHPWEREVTAVGVVTLLEARDLRTGETREIAMECPSFAP